MSDFKIKLDKGAMMPVRKTEGSAAYDVYTQEDFCIKSGRNVIPTGIHLEFPPTYQALIEARSGFSVKGIETYLTPESSTPFYLDADVIAGKLDSDHRGAVGVIVYNRTPFSSIVKKGTRIAQLTFVPIATPVLELVEKLSATERGNGGFGHTGSR